MRRQSRWLNYTLPALSAVLVLMPGCARHHDEPKATSGPNLTGLRPFQPVIKKVYEYSLIPGGVENASAFRVFRATDKVLLQHFRNIGDELVSTTLSKDKRMYTSYRVRDSIYWTKNRVLVHAGEALLTDGRSLVRSRCGNRLSDSPHTPVQAVQPPAITTDGFTVEVAMETPPPLIPEIEAPFVPGAPDLTAPTPVEGPYVPVLPVESGDEIPPIPVPLPPDSGRDILLPTPLPAPITVPTAAHKSVVVPLIPTPEPDTWRLTLIGMFFFAGLSLRSFVRRRRIVARDAESH